MVRIGSSLPLGRAGKERLGLIQLRTPRFQCFHYTISGLGARMTMKMILRDALEKDLPTLEEILKPWTEADSAIPHQIRSAITLGSSGLVHCRVLGTENTITCVSLWMIEKGDQIRLLAFGNSKEASKYGADVGFLKELIMEWAQMGVSKVTIQIPETAAPSLATCLRGCGFMFEGICSTCRSEHRPWITFCKHFLYRTISHEEVIEFLRDFLLRIGYEVRREEEGFVYRVRSEFLPPFIFSAWHRVSRSGPDVILHPPARVLQSNELETLFYPLTIRERHEKALLMPLQRKRAAQLLELPRENNHQDSLFSRSVTSEPKLLRLDNVALSDPAGVQSLRKGLSVLFYVNRVGAVGTARIEDWALDDAEVLHDTLIKGGWLDHWDPREKATALEARSGKVLAIRFQWYQPLKRAVTLEQIRRMDRTFNPQRLRSLSPKLFESIVACGNEQESTPATARASR